MQHTIIVMIGLCYQHESDFTRRQCIHIRFKAAIYSSENNSVLTKLYCKQYTVHKEAMSVELSVTLKPIGWLIGPQLIIDVRRPYQRA